MPKRTAEEANNEGEVKRTQLVESPLITTTREKVNRLEEKVAKTEDDI
jgi:hypothetical protein